MKYLSDVQAIINSVLERPHLDFANKFFLKEEDSHHIYYVWKGYVTSVSVTAGKYHTLSNACRWEVWHESSTPDI